MIKANLNLDANAIAKMISDKIDKSIDDSEALEHLAPCELGELSNIIYLTIEQSINEINKLELVGG